MKKIIAIVIFGLIGYYVYKSEKLNSELMEMNKDLTFKYFESATSEKSNGFIYQNGIQRIEIKILNGNNFLEYDKPIETDIILTEINPRNVLVFGTGIRVLNNQNGIMKTKINVPSNYLESDTLNVKINFGKKQEERIEFNIPIKKAE